MANIKISELTLVTPASADEMVVVDATDSASKRITVGSLPDTTYTASGVVSIDGSNAITSTATVNDTDANLKARANHTGTQAASTISDFDTEVANNTAVTANTAKVTNATHTGDVTGATALTIADDAVDIAHLSATGTASATTFLRGDNSWVVPTDTNTTYSVQDGELSQNNLTNTLKGYYDTGYTHSQAAHAPSGAEANAANTAITTADTSWSGSQRGTPSVVTDGTLDLNTANNFKYTPAAADTLEFSNETAGQAGFITVINPSAYTISLGSEVKKGASWDVSTAGTYLVSYYSDGTSVYVSASEALS